MELNEAVLKIQESMDIISKIKIRRDIETYSYSKVFKISTSQTKKLPDEPNYVFKNPKQTDVMITDLNIIFDGTMQTTGVIQIISDGRILLETEKSGDLEIRTEWKKKYEDGLLLKKDSDVKFFVWSDGTAVKCSGDINLGDVRQ